MVTENPRPRGRPRRFDPQDAVAEAQALFHAHGYDGVSVADITRALGINPPSFYAAFGSKAGLYARVLDRWAGAGAIPIGDILSGDRPVADGLTALLEAAARRYAADPAAAGCLVLESLRCGDPQARDSASAHALAAESAIRGYIAERHPAEAARVADFVVTTMTGLSAKARTGHDVDRLLATARLAASAVRRALEA